jgi:Signal transduction histidine kinase
MPQLSAGQKPPSGIPHAVKYSYDGDIAVQLRREPRTDGDWAVMTIADTGLGLSGVRRIVVQHGGDVTIASAEGVGTTVTVALPMGEPPAEASETDV